jgi:hypothetical protein
VIFLLLVLIDILQPSELTESGLGRGLFAYYDGKEYGVLKTPLLTNEEMKK